VPRVVAANPRHAVDGFLHGAEHQQAFAGRQLVADPCVLDQRGLAAGEVADGAIADPAAARRHVHLLRDAELGAGRLDVLLIVFRRLNDFCGIHKLPAVAGERKKIASVSGVDVER
jgi:hypothetical protein